MNSLDLKLKPPTRAFTSPVKGSITTIPPFTFGNCLKLKFPSEIFSTYIKSFTLKIRFIKQQTAYRASHYLGAKLLDPKTISYSNDDYDNIMRFILFTVV